MNLRILSLFVFFTLLSLSALAQSRERFNNDKSKSGSNTPPEQKDPEEIVNTNANAKTTGNIWDKLVFGGDASLSIGAATFIYVAPSVGYLVNPDLIAGAGFIYQYSKLNQIYNYSTNQFEKYDGDANTIYGPKIFANYRFLENFYAGTQFEYLNHDFFFVNNSGTQTEQNLWTSVWFVEAGLSRRIGRKGSAMIGIRYNLLDDIQSPYATAWYPVIGIFF